MLPGRLGPEQKGWSWGGREAASSVRTQGGYGLTLGSKACQILTVSSLSLPGTPCGYQG